MKIKKERGYKPLSLPKISYGIALKHVSTDKTTNVGISFPFFISLISIFIPPFVNNLFC